MLYRSYHLVTVSQNEKGEINFHDSLSNGNIPRVFLLLICDLPLTKYLLRCNQYNNNQTKLTVESFLLLLQLPMHLVTGLVTCEQTSLRFDLNKCLKLDKFFPYQVINGKRQKRVKEIIIAKDVYCACRRTYFQEHTE